MGVDWFRRRSYAHFDRPMTEEEARELATCPARVAVHAFWPLIINPKRSVSRKPASEKEDGRVFSVKRRPIGYSAHSDAHIFAYYAHVLNERLEALYSRHGGSHVLAYRTFSPPRCNIHFAAEAFEEIAQRGQCEVLALDVEGFFDSLDHALLKAAWCRLLDVERLPADHFKVFKACTGDFAVPLPVLRDALGGDIRRRAGREGVAVCTPKVFREKVVHLLRPRHELVWEAKRKARPSNVASGAVGIPQGLPISAVLANLYMFDADSQLVAGLTALGGSFRRYSDDILVIVPPGYAREAEELVVRELQAIGLSVNANKTERTSVRSSDGVLRTFALREDGQEGSQRPLSYLGLAFEGVQSVVRPSTVSKFQQKACRAIDRAMIAARRNGEKKLRRRQLYAKLTSLGHGDAYGSTQLSPDAPRLGFYRYMRQAERITKSPGIARQIRQLEQRVYRWLDRADSQLALTV
jgi:RNA-directed DNA polymerase